MLNKFITINYYIISLTFSEAFSKLCIMPILILEQIYELITN